VRSYKILKALDVGLFVFLFVVYFKKPVALVYNLCMMIVTAPLPLNSLCKYHFLSHFVTPRSSIALRFGFLFNPVVAALVTNLIHTH